MEHDTRPDDRSGGVIVWLFAALIAALAVGVGVQSGWFKHEPPAVTAPSNPGWDDQGYPIAPDDGELPITRPPAKPEPRWTCEFSSEYQRTEDAFLSTVLGSPVDDDPLFGLTEYGMEAAECAARRWRLEGR